MAGGGKATIREVAKLAGVSIKTVSNVLNDYPYIRPETKQRVLDAIAQLGYHTNISARNLKRGRTGVIALVVPSLRVDYFAELADSVMRAAAGHGLSVFIEQTDAERDRELRVLKGDYQAQFDGVIFSPLALGQDDAALFAVDFPLVILGERIFGAGVDHVTMHNVEAARAATEHVIAAGARVVVPLGSMGGPGPNSGTLRMEGFAQAMAAHGLPVDPRAIIEVGDYYHATGARVLAEILDRGITVEAIVAFSDTLAVGCLPVLHDRGYRVPDDVMVVGFDNIDETEYSIPPLTTIDAGREEIARLATAMLDERIRARLAGLPAAEQPPPRTALASYRLVQRRSTRPTAG
jgi:DNA-binding LacI/PurR family transcriptional regulator